jgi:hypothetical protein
VAICTRDSEHGQLISGEQFKESARATGSEALGESGGPVLKA